MRMGKVSKEGKIYDVRERKGWGRIAREYEIQGVKERGRLKKHSDCPNNLPGGKAGGRYRTFIVDRWHAQEWEGVVVGVCTSSLLIASIHPVNQEAKSCGSSAAPWMGMAGGRDQKVKKISCKLHGQETSQIKVQVSRVLVMRLFPPHHTALCPLKEDIQPRALLIMQESNWMNPSPLGSL